MKYLIILLLLLVPTQVFADETHKGSLPLCSEFIDPKEADKFSHCEAPKPSKNIWGGYLEFTGEPGTKGNSGEVSLFLPFLQDKNDLTFFNTTGQFDDNDNKELNLGVGHRHMFNNFILGGYGFYDAHTNAFGNDFKQMSFGAEVMTENFDLRINGYIPDDEIKIDGAGPVVIIQDRQIKVGIGIEKALHGIDGEIGYKLPIPNLFNFGLFDNTRLYAGAYHFFGDDTFKSITGPRVRLETVIHDISYLGIGSHITLGLKSSYDDTNGHDTSGLLAVRIPFGFGARKAYTPLKGLEDRMLEPIERDGIVTQNGKKLVDAISPFGKAYTEYREFDSVEDMRNQIQGKEDIEHWFANLGGSSTSTKEWIMDQDNLPGSFGTLAIAGKWAPIKYDNPFSGKRESFRFTPRGFAPKMVFNNGLSYAMTLGHGTHLNGWDIDAVGKRDGIIIRFGEGIRHITNTKLYNYNQSGIAVRGKNRILHISDSEIIGRWNGEPEVEFFEGAGLYSTFGAQIFADNMKVLNNRGNGVIADFGQPQDGEGPAYIEIKNSVVSGNRGHGVFADYDSIIIADNLLVEDNGGTGVGAGNFGNNLSFLKISNSIIRRSGRENLISNGGATVIAEFMTIEDSKGVGVAIWGGTNAEHTGVLRISDSTISGSARFGLSVNPGNQPVPRYANLFVDRVVFKDNKLGSIYMQLPEGTATINDSKFFDTPAFVRDNSGSWFGTGNTDGDGNPIFFPIN